MSWALLSFTPKVFKLTKLAPSSTDFTSPIFSNVARISSRNLGLNSVIRVSNTDLLSLLTVSRQMHAYAEPELLRRVSLSVKSAHDDSQSSVIQFHHFIAAPTDYRQRLVHTLSINFMEDIPFPSEAHALEQLIPTLINLRSMVLNFVRYIPSTHGHSSLFKEGLGGLSLRDLDIAVGEADSALDVTELVRSQPSIHHLELVGNIEVADDKALLPELRFLSTLPSINFIRRWDVLCPHFARGYSYHGFMQSLRANNFSRLLTNSTKAQISGDIPPTQCSRSCSLSSHAILFILPLLMFMSR